MFAALKKIDGVMESALKPLVPVLLLVSRLWVAWVFFKSGQTKIASWDSTLFLFEYEYQVPLIPWEVAAYLGTAAELILPVFLAFGLLTRPAAFALFAFNIIAVVSYPALWPKGFFDHQMWGVMLLVTMIWGPGLAAFDNWLKKRS
ncbi:DoxX family protein [Grimontia hollisae]|uniref:Membrane protein n=2 Tax=Grimontia hollisae TaxID=673 RepID=D0I352_GRIHO|nr:DoxX family protein [Grimontia hollisae]AMG30686.1 DoxX family protein [Grimontia hollisae]EEY74094.1 membrane protein [Grimontia hollisae CIP 101886]MDF2184837.1 DoxX family protein [Grimontia hollisae]STO47630.1 DoxX [Grimontia hollisae]STO58487.1 DoxX [Grimontia hollisae]